MHKYALDGIFNHYNENNKMNLRDYQNEALSSVIKSFKSKIHKQVIVLPTGAGKTVLFIAIAQLNQAGCIHK